MTLATRCPKCTTVFRVVQDQLRVSEGWVRCGRCSEVFNASQHLVDPATGDLRRSPIEVHSGVSRSMGLAPPPPAPAPSANAPSRRRAAAPPPPPPASRPLPPTPPPPAPAPPPPAPRAAPHDAGASIDLPLDLEDQPRAAPAPSSPAPAPSGQTGAAAAGAAAETAATATATAAAPAPAPAADRTPSEPLPAALRIDIPSPRPVPAGGGALPSFVREAERAERWRSPGMRALLLVLLLTALLLLAAQALYVWRDRAAARWPEWRATLEAACAPLGCRIEHARDIEALAVESSGLVRVDKSDLYRIAVALRNQQDFAVALPAIDLSLTDTQGRLIARRVVRPADLGVTAATVAARAELSMQGTIQVSAAPVAGYTIELFYP